MPQRHYIFMILGTTAYENNCRESPTELLLPCDRAALAKMKPEGCLGYNSNKILTMCEVCFL